MSEDDLVTDEVRAKENRVIVAAERKRWEQVKKTAEKAERWEHFVGDRLRAIWRDEGTATPPRPPVVRAHGLKDEIVVVTHATDLHFGKWASEEEVGSENNRKITRERLMDATSTLMARASSVGRIASVVLGAGGDLVHIDNLRKQTTAGTPQDADGTYPVILAGVLRLSREHVNHVRQFSPSTTVVPVIGNHDGETCLYLAHHLAAVYEDAPDVTVREASRQRHYIEEGANLIGFTHGERVKDADLASLMAIEAPQAWGRCPFRIVIAGHWHTLMVNEVRGVVVAHLPSLAGTDAWHHASGYVGNRKAMTGYVLSRREGLVGTVQANAGFGIDSAAA